MKEHLKREIITTSDGSRTIHFPELNEHYHSKHGAINEAKHVFLKQGFHHILSLFPVEELSIVEIGFGTGLNALLTYIDALQKNQLVQYTGVEAYPVSLEEVKGLNYVDVLGEVQYQDIFDQMHSIAWDIPSLIAPAFTLTKRQQLFSDISDKEAFHLIYFDAFGARVQPELWTVTIFQKMYTALKENGVLVTYSAKGSVRRAMQEVGFTVERLPGPPGKREMLRGTKTI